MVLGLRTCLNRVVAALGLLALCAGAPAIAESDVSRTLAQAEAYLWLSMATDGDPRSIAKAKDALKSLGGTAGGAEAAALAQALDVQQTMATETLTGIFPLSRLLAGEEAPVRYEIAEPAMVAASNAALRRLLDDPSGRVRDQAMLVVLAPPKFERLEGEALVLAAGKAHVAPLTRRGVIQALGGDATAMAELETARHGPATTRRLLAAAGGADVLVIWIRPLSLKGGDMMVEIAARRYFADEKHAPQSYVSRGFGFDRSGAMVQVAALTALFAALAVAGVWYLLRRRAIAHQPLAHDLGAALAAFALGRLAPLGAFKLAATAVPAPAADAQLGASFWWPAWVGVVLFVLPIVVWRLAGARLALQAPWAAASGRLGALGLAVGLGAAAHAALPLSLYLEGDAVLPALAAALAAAAIGFGLGRAFDRFDPLHVLWGLAPLLLAPALGAALSSARLPALVATAAAALAAVVLAGRLGRTGAPVAETETEEARHTPRAWQLPATAQVLDSAAPFGPGAVLWLGLVGGAGSGKTTLLDRMTARLREQAGAPVILRGRCTPLPESTCAPPFGPIQQALGGQFAPGLSQDGVNAAIGSAIDNAAAMLLGPMAGFLRGDGGVASEADLFVFVARKLQELAVRAPVALIIDDAQWLDPSSQALLAYLRAHLRGESGRGIAIVVAGSDDGGLWPGLGLQPLRIDSLTTVQQTDFLVAGLGLSETAALWTLSWLGDGARTPGDLRAVVDHLRGAGVLVESELNASRPAEVPPLPGAAQRVRAALATLPEARTALTAAACLGLRFELSLLAAALDRPLGETIALMDEIARRTGLIQDDRGCDDIFAFVSLQVLDAVRAELGCQLRGPLAADVPQIVRHLNSRLADHLAEGGDGWPDSRLRLAAHAFAAGRSHAALGVSAGLEAAAAMTRMFRYDDARATLARAHDCAQITGEGAAVARMAWRVDAAEAHVRGIAEVSARAARRGLELLRSDDGAQVLLPEIAQACFDGSRADGGLQDETARLGARMAESGGELAAEGLHLMALAAPRQPGSPLRVDTLRRALAAARSVPTQARIANSLAEELSGGDAAGKAEARTLFLHSLELKNQADIRDLPGLARTHGGLGRLAFFATPPDIAAARHHFTEDLRLSEQIGDQRGVSKMESLLGACARAEGRWGEAEAHFRRSITMDVDPLDVCLSLAGLLQCHRATGDGESFAAVAEEAQGRDFTALPAFARDQLAAALHQDAKA